MPGCVYSILTSCRYSMKAKVEELDRKCIDVLNVSV